MWESNLCLLGLLLSPEEEDEGHSSAGEDGSGSLKNRMLAHTVSAKQEHCKQNTK